MEFNGQVEWERESELALRAVSTGGELLLERNDKISVATKESYRDVVTEYDRRVENHILKILSPSGYSALAEESSNQWAESSSSNAPYWAVDPIDGTANFVSGMPIFGVSVGLVQKNLSVEGLCVGAISLPAAKELYFTHGKYSYLNGRRLKANASLLQNALIVAGFSGEKGDPQFRRKQYELFGTINDSSRGCLRLGSAAAAISYVAAGRLQGAYAVHAQIWDVAAALTIAKNAGYQLWISAVPASTRVNYIVGSPAVVDAIFTMGKSLEIF